jgi:branched-chain amino acid transport system substrate-binding protein
VHRRSRLAPLAAALLVVACGKEAPAPATSAPPTVTVKIAHAGPLTGSIAHQGKDDENGVALAVMHANAMNLVLGGKRVKFEMVSEDDQADPKIGTLVAQKLVDAKVAAVIGHLNSGVSIPASDIYNRAGIPMISGAATNPSSPSAA